MEPGPPQVRQEDSHVTHVATEPTTPEKVPMLGHSATHMLLCRKGVSAEAQLAQSELVGPVQVPHVAPQGWQTLLLSAYLPMGRHEARHEPGESKNGYEAAHVVHSVARGPEHVAHDSAHATHTSRDAALPPKHVNPASMAQLALHPSRLTRLPSSQPSDPTCSPSPHTEAHESCEVILPPLHSYPTSIVQLAEQPSPARVLLSSHSSKALHGTFLPSPQIGMQVSSPPIPEPPSTSAVDVQWKPSSISQRALQPSPPNVSPSSQGSAVLRMPLPQM